VEAAVGIRGGREAGVLADGPRAGGVHQRVDAAGERVTPGLAQLGVRVEARGLPRPVDRVDRQTGFRLARHAYKATLRARGGRWAAAPGWFPGTRGTARENTITFRRAYATESPLPSRDPAGGWRQRIGSSCLCHVRAGRS
jgi:hypothetical protein